MQDGGESLGAGHAECLAETELVEQIVWDSGHRFRSLAVETSGQQGDEAANCGRLPRHVGVDVHLAAVQLDPEEDRGLALVHPIVAELFFRFQALGQWRQLFE